MKTQTQDLSINFPNPLFTFRWVCLLAMIAHLNSPDGLQRFRDCTKNSLSAASAACMLSMISCFREQSGPTMCGPATLALALNSVTATTDCADSCVISDIDLLLAAQCDGILDKDSVLAEGMTLDSFAILARARSSHATNTATLDGMQSVTVLRSPRTQTQAPSAKDMAKDTILANLEIPHVRVVVNYDMSTAGQTPWAGHFSGIAAYHSASDSFLVMDVWVYTQPAWIPWDALYAATCVPDTCTGLTRGFAILNLSELAQGRAVSTDLEMTDDQVVAVLEKKSRRNSRRKVMEMNWNGRLEKVSYIDEGASLSPPFVILHDYLSDAECFGPVINYLAVRDMRALALDLPGYGGNAPMAPCTSMEQWVKLVMSFLQALNVQSCVLVGHSSGSMIAQQVAASHPEVVHQLILSGGTCIGRMPKRFETLEQSMENFQRLGFIAHAIELVRRGFQNMQPSTYQHAYLAERALARTSEAAVRASCSAMLSWGDQGRFNLDDGLIRAPTLILWGDSDHLIEKTLANRLKESISGSTLFVLPNAGHLSHLELPSIIGESILYYAKGMHIPQFRCEFFEAAEMALCMQDDRYVSKALLAALPPKDERVPKHFRLTCGIVHNLQSGNKRCEKFCEIFPALSLEEHKLRFYKCMQNLLSETDRRAFVADWDVEEFFLAGQEVKQKRTNLLPELQRDFDYQPFVKNHTYKPETVIIPEFSEASIKKSMRTSLHDCILTFDPYFLRRVHLSLLAVARPEGAFQVDDIETSDNSDLLISKLKQNATREKCEKCGSNCYLYCGSCGGIRTSLADKLLPPRIDLKVFDVLIVLHWQERVTSCTGITAAVMAMEGQVQVARWPKTARDRPHLLSAYPRDQTQREMDKVLQEIDCETDFLLFPGPGSVDATLIDWNMQYMTQPSTNSKNGDMAALNGANLAYAQPRKRRLIVVESNWSNGKTVYNDLIAGLQSMHGMAKAAKLRCLSLSNVVGKFWKFQAVGHSAVSTIEAIHHAAIIAKKLMKPPDATSLGEESETAFSENSNHDEYDALLVLFRLQRNRLLKEMKRSDRGLPRAMRVSGCGVGDWAVVLEAHQLNLIGQVEK